MLRVNPVPSTWLKAFAAASHAALWLLAAAWITLGLVWGGLHFLIVPRIADFRPWLEQQASQRMGVAVRVGDIVARSNGLIPSIELRDVRLLDADGRVALHLPSVLAALSPRSALSLGFEQLYVDSPELSVRRTADGRIWIAGLALPDGQADGQAADWLFSQTELAVRHGTVRWTDELRGQPALDLSDVDLVIRNRHRSHSLRLDANPPAGWGERLSLRGRFQQDLFSRSPGDWRNWAGQLYAEAPHVDLARLGAYVDLGLELREGAGSLRAWVDVDHARWQAATADLALQSVQLRAAPELATLAFAHVTGRLGVQRLAGGYTFSAQALGFDTLDGLHWPGGNLQLSLWDANARRAAHGALQADRLELAALRDIANRLPLPESLQGPLQGLAPTGLVEQLQLDWQGALQQPQTYAASGRVSALALAPLAQWHTPGVRGAQLEFKFDQGGGRASVALHNGVLAFPGLLERPELALDTLSGELQWKFDGEATRLSIDKLRFANADAQGEAQLRWQTAALPRGAPASQRFPGVLDLGGSLSRANLVALPHYLPLALDAELRTYLAQALLGGEGSNVHFKVKGDLARFPFASAREGEFRITADVRNAQYAYAPPLLMPKDSAPWPMLTQTAGEFVLDRDTLQIKGARGVLASGGGLPFSRADATISRLYDAPLVLVTADARAPLADVLGLVNASPVGGWTGGALARSSATGSADYRLRLSMPLAQMEKSQVQGSVQLAGNEFGFAPGIPRLARLRGQLTFTDNSFSMNGMQARALGGDVRIDGGLAFGSAASARNAPTSMRFQGTATAEGLRGATELGLAARLAQFSSGSAAYSATLGLRGGVPELAISSGLSGLALNLPEPLFKSADSVLPLRLENTVVRAANASGGHALDQWQLELGRLASVSYVRDTTSEPAQVLRGAIALGLNADEAAPLPAEGVVANLRMGSLDVDAWSAVLARLGAPGIGAPAGASGASTLAYLPSSVALRARELLVEGRRFNNVLLGGVRDGATWRGNVDASELNGYVEYRQSNGSTPGRVYARLAHLVIGTSAAQDVENLLDQQPLTIPALDIVVDDLDLRGKKLGRIEVQAVNLGLGPTREAVREWRLNRFNISTPEATLTATGNWVGVNAQAALAAPATRPMRERRRTALNFKLDVADSGELLKRMGMPGVIAKGKGVVAGQVAWLGSPFTPDYPSMSGGFNINMESGQFLKADPGVAKLLGVLSLQSLPRRLALDFRDVFSEGFAFDFVRGDVAIEQGMARTGNLQMKGVNAIVMMDGQADIAKETQSIKVLVIPEINVASASLLYSAINPLVGLTTFLANLIFRGPLVNANTQEFLIDGSWLDPRVTKLDRKAEPPAAPASATKR